jgi:hypothetical protein
MSFALFILYLIVSYIYPGEIVPALAPYRITYLVGLAGLAVAIASLLRTHRGRAANLQLWVLIVFTAVMGLSLTIAERWVGAPFLVIQRFAPSMTMFLLAICSVTSFARLRVTVVCVIALTVVLVVQGAAAYHFGYNTRLFLMDRSTQGDDVSETDVDDQAQADSLDESSGEPAEDEEGPEVPRIRALGLMNDPNDLAMGIIVALGLIGGAVKPAMRFRNLVLAVAASALVYGIYLTRSRGGAVALVIVLWRFAATRIGRLPALILLGVLTAGTLALDFGGRSLSAEMDESAAGRLDAWTEGLEMLKAQPILGVGYGQFLDHHILTAHNSLVLCFAETGLLGCFLWVGLFVVTLMELRGLKDLPGASPFDDAARQWAGGLHLALVGFMTAAFFLSRTFVPMLYLIFGLSAASALMAREDGRPLAMPPLASLATLVAGCELAGIGVVYMMVKLHVA